MSAKGVPVYVCSKCGVGPGTVIEGRPSLDDRYAVGYCPAGCTPVPRWDSAKKRTVPESRPTVPLIRADKFDPAKLADRDRRAAEVRLVRKAAGNDLRLTDAQRDEAAEIQRRWDREAAERRSA